MGKQLSIIGAGHWGCALALSFAKHYEQVHLWCYNQLEQDSIAPMVFATPNINLSFELEPITQSEAVLLVVPSYGFEQSLLSIKPYLNTQFIAWASKGFDVVNQGLLHQTFIKILPHTPPCLISGPSFAAEVLAQKPTALVVSSPNKEYQAYWSNSLQSNRSIRAYLNADIIGAQVGGSVKNVLAIAAGIVSGLEYGTNTQAALITRGLNEMMCLGLVLGAKRETFMGLTGLGDLVLTCSDDLSRNRQFGAALVKLGDVAQAKKAVNSTIEGLNALEITLLLAKQHQVEMPICQQVLQVVNGHISPQKAIDLLMDRDVVSE